MNAEWKFNLEPIGEPLCVYDGSQKSIDNCVKVMCENLGIEQKDGAYPAEMIMVVLWARILQLQERAQIRPVCREGNWITGEKT